MVGSSVVDEMNPGPVACADDSACIELMNAPSVASIGTLIGDPSRALMISALMDGRARTATELADAAGVTRQTASSHLTRLVDAGLLERCQQGRHRYFRVGNEEVATALETLMVVKAPAIAERGILTPLERARTCYDHLAGSLGVALLERLCEKNYLELRAGGVQLSDSGRDFFNGLGIVLQSNYRRPVARMCLDWSERRYHLAGALGAALLTHFVDNKWLRLSDTSRAVTMTSTGKQAFYEVFGMSDVINDE